MLRVKTGGQSSLTSMEPETTSAQMALWPALYRGMEGHVTSVMRVTYAHIRRIIPKGTTNLEIPNLAKCTLAWLKWS